MEAFQPLPGNNLAVNQVHDAVVGRGELIDCHNLGLPLRPRGDFGIFKPCQHLGLLRLGQCDGVVPQLAVLLADYGYGILNLADRQWIERVRWLGDPVEVGIELFEPFEHCSSGGVSNLAGGEAERKGGGMVEEGPRVDIDILRCWGRKCN